VTSSLALFEDAIRLKSTHLIKPCLKTRKKRKHKNQINFLHKSPSKRTFRHRIYSLPKRADTRGSADIMYLIWCVSLRVRHSYWGQKVGQRSRMEYLIQTNDTILLDS